jgi:hypothetical protein
MTPRKKPSLSKKSAPKVQHARKVTTVQTKKISQIQAKKISTQTKKSFTIRSLHLGTHFAIASSAIAVLLVLGFFDRATFSTLLGHASENAVTATIGLEYDAPLSLAVLFARKDGAGYVSIANKSDQTIHVSTPSTWSRTEVTGVPLSSVTQEIPVFGFTRWSLPPHAGVRMLMPEAPASVFFDSPSAATAAVELQTIDLTTLDVSNKVLLVQKQALVSLWGNGN